ncbi:MAG: TlpA disulfide reductase family protein [Candidatus Zixiibacteriota bacterium]
MKLNHKALLSFSVLIILGALVFNTSCGKSDTDTTQAGTIQKESAGTSQSTDKNLPSMNRERFSLRDLNGNIRKWSEFAGKPVVINFWATWCGPCLRELPTLKKLYAEYQSHGIEIIGISVDQQNTIERVVPYVEQMDIPWVIVYGDAYSTREFGLGQSIPTTVFLDANGKETGRLIGAQPEHIFRAEFEKII